VRLAVFIRIERSKIERPGPPFVLAAGLSPAWQQIVVLEELRTGEVNRAREVHWSASGKVLNVGLALQALAGSRSPSDRAAMRSRILSTVGGAAGAAIAAEFRDAGIDTRWVRTSSPTRVCTTVLDRSNGRVTELVENAAPIGAGELNEFRTAFREMSRHAEVIVLTGSLPAGVPASLYCELLQDLAPRTILDCQGELLLESLAARPFIVKPNREELGRTFGRRIETELQLHAAMRELNDRGAEWVVVTQGKGSVWISSRAQLVAIEPHEVPVVNPIGSGDCLAAGIAIGLANGYTVADATSYGIAAAADNVGRLLPARLDPSAVNALFEGRRFQG
jgi:1-phosphofructokinase family hexose kinase